MVAGAVEPLNTVEPDDGGRESTSLTSPATCTLLSFRYSLCLLGGSLLRFSYSGGRCVGKEFLCRARLREHSAEPIEELPRLLE